MRKADGIILELIKAACRTLGLKSSQGVSKNNEEEDNWDQTLPDYDDSNVVEVGEEQKSQEQGYGEHGS